MGSYTAPFRFPNTFSSFGPQSQGTANKQSLTKRAQKMKVTLPTINFQGPSEDENIMTTTVDRMKALKNRLPGLKSKIDKAWQDEAAAGAKQAKAKAEHHTDRASKHEVVAAAWSGNHQFQSNHQRAQDMHNTAAMHFNMAHDAYNRGEMKNASQNMEDGKKAGKRANNFATGLNLQTK